MLAALPILPAAGAHRVGSEAPTPTPTPEFDPSIAGEPHLWFDFGHEASRTLDDARIIELGSRSSDHTLTVPAAHSGPVAATVGAGQWDGETPEGLSVGSFGSGGAPVTAIMVRFYLPEAVNRSSAGRSLLGFGVGNLGIHFGSNSTSFGDEVITLSPTSGQFWVLDSDSAEVGAGWHTITCVATGSEWEVYLDGESVVNASSGTYSPITQSALQIGRRGNGSFYWSGLVAEVVAWRGNFDGNARSELEVALAHKWKGQV